MILALISAASVAIACTKDSSTVKQPATLAGTLAGTLAALHLDNGGASAPVNGKSAGMSEARIVIAICPWPSYSLAVSSAISNASSPTAYTLPGTNGFRPDLYVSVIGWEIQKRWRDSSIFRPIASFGAGTIHAKYHYALTTPTGHWDDSAEQPGRTPYYMPAVGIEASVFTYVTLYALAGERYANEMKLPGLEKGAFSGRYAAFGMGLGKFR